MVELNSEKINVEFNGESYTRKNIKVDVEIPVIPSDFTEFYQRKINICSNG